MATLWSRYFCHVISPPDFHLNLTWNSRGVFAGLLHTNELPLRHVFTMLDGTTNSPDTFAGPIGKCLTGDVSSWLVAANFKSISNPKFVQLPESVVNDLSTDQHYAYKICSAIIMELSTATCNI